MGPATPTAAVDSFPGLTVHSATASVPRKYEPRRNTGALCAWWQRDLAYVRSAALSIADLWITFRDKPGHDKERRGAFPHAYFVTVSPRATACSVSVSRIIAGPAKTMNIDGMMNRISGSTR